MLIRGALMFMQLCVADGVPNSVRSFDFDQHTTAG